MKKSHPGVVVAPAVEEYCVKPSFDSDGVQVSSGIRSDGKEDIDPVPLEPPLSYRAPPDILHMIKDMVRNERLMAKLDEEGFDTFEEAEDFDVDDDPVDPLTVYERVFEPPPAGAPAGGDRGTGQTAPQAAAGPPTSTSKPDVSGGREKNGGGDLRTPDNDQGGPGGDNSRSGSQVT